WPRAARRTSPTYAAVTSPVLSLGERVLRRPGIRLPTTVQSVFTDNFNRADGALGANWAAGNDTAETIVSNQVVGTASLLRNAKRTSESYGNDHYSQIQIGTGGLASGDFIGPVVRLQADGFTSYAALYFNNPANGGSRVIPLYKRTAAGAYNLIDPSNV